MTQWTVIIVSDGVFDPFHIYGSAVWVIKSGFYGPKLAWYHTPGEAEN